MLENCIRDGVFSYSRKTLILATAARQTKYNPEVPYVGTFRVAVGILTIGYGYFVVGRFYLARALQYRQTVLALRYFVPSWYGIKRTFWPYILGKEINGLSFATLQRRCLPVQEIGPTSGVRM
jgi:hypothetical protein